MLLSPHLELKAQDRSLPSIAESREAVKAEEACSVLRPTIKYPIYIILTVYAVHLIICRYSQDTWSPP